MKSLILLIVVIFALLILVAPQAYASPANSPDAAPVLFGKAAQNGDLLALYYTNPLGQVEIISQSSQVPIDTLNLIIYSPIRSGELNVSVFTYTMKEVQITIKQGNLTTNLTQDRQFPIAYMNQTFNVSARSIMTFSLSLPYSSAQSQIQVSYDGAVFQFQHKTTPNAIPVFLTSGGELGLMIIVFVLTSLVWGLGALTSKLIMKRARYWPQRSASSWILIFIFLGIAVYFFVGTYYYDLGYVQWWYFLIPVWFIANMVMLSWWPANVERWELMTLKGGKENKVYHDVEKVYVSPHAKATWIKIERDSRIDAFKRLIGQFVPIRFAPGEPPWYMENESWEDPVWDTRRVYLMDPEKGPAHFFSLEKSRFWRFVHHSVEYHIPLSGHYTKDAADFLSEEKAVLEIAKENESLRKENRNFRIQFTTGKRKVGYEEVNDITRKLYEAELEYHAGSIEPEEGKPEKNPEKKEKKEDEDVKEGKK